MATPKHTGKMPPALAKYHAAKGVPKTDPTTQATPPPKGKPF